VIKLFIQQQFNSIPANINATTSSGTSEENKHKNKYKNICPYDHSRVLLKTSSEKKWGDYVNASYIDGYREQRKFIASQGPTKATLEYFLRMLLEQGVEVVVMVTNLAEGGKVKCERYWPEDDVIQAGDIKVQLTTSQVFADYTIRRLQLLLEGDCVHELTQFHFTAWPDKDVSTTAWSLVDFEQRVAFISTDKPIVVHCSAGVGRTGTFIALSNVLVEAVEIGYMDFFTAVQKLRHDRACMVQTSAQYEFLHRVALVAVVCMGTTVAFSNIAGKIESLNNAGETGEPLLNQEFKALCDICYDGIGSYEDKETESSRSAYENNQCLSNKLKNRFQNILAKEDYRVIMMQSSNEGLGDYINAVFVPSFRRTNQQILTQLPLPTTVTDFWRMATQYKVTLVVTFELDLMDVDSPIGKYFPCKDNEEVSTPHFKIKSQPTSSCVLWDEHKVFVSSDTPRTASKPVSTGSDKKHRLVHINCKGPLTNQRPEELLALMKVVRSHSPLGDGRTVYMCRNGAEYSGLVCVLSLLLDRLDNDHHLTVPLVVGAVKAIRPQVIPTAHQYNLLYQVLMMYNDSNNVYSNLGT
jgi:protein tyrosine phosphatase